MICICKSRCILIRFFDLLLSTIGLIFLFPVFLIIFLLGLLDTGSPIFRQSRIGKNKKAFRIIKFRTMVIGTTSLPTHFTPPSSITRLGAFLRGTKLDELPQLWNVFKGEMSLVGPRPNLPNQHDVIRERSRLRIYDVRPGITGLSQLNGVDMSNPKELAQTDRRMLDTLTVKSYFRCIFKTLL